MKKFILGFVTGAIALKVVYDYVYRDIPISIKDQPNVPVPEDYSNIKEDHYVDITDINDYGMAETL